MLKWAVTARDQAAVSQWSSDGRRQRAASSVSLNDDDLTGNGLLSNINKKTASQPDLCAYSVSTLEVTSFAN